MLVQISHLLISEGWMTANGTSEAKPVRFMILVGEAGGEWQIDAIFWQVPQGEAQAAQSMR
ncbi:MAG: hypothetical protein ABI871_02815 [Chthoniobacterales bacterium]